MHKWLRRLNSLWKILMNKDANKEEKLGEVVLKYMYIYWIIYFHLLLLGQFQPSVH